MRTLIALMICLLFASGCADSQYGQVTGVVQLDGEPLPDAFVVFYPEDAASGTTAHGRTGSNGGYHMLISDSHSGMLPGSYRVKIHTSDIAINDKGREYQTPEHVPARYNKATELTGYQVVAGESHVFDFDLKSK